MNPTEAIIKDFTLEIPVRDIAQSVEWYSRHLGFELVPPAK
ncbi:VOC family protein [Paenibacillus mesophilus]|nr:VOC family protein [Paenibacillus mesophilus]TMV45963.1 VOC family protein [Paenibacillus mesophilus]